MTSSSARVSSTAADPIEELFRPQSVAVVGASANRHSQGYEFVEGLIKLGFPGPIYPVNPKLDELLGRKAYARLEDVPGTVDFVISAVPAAAILELVDGARAKQTKLLHLFTARFSETGRADAAELEREFGRRTREAGIRVIGPNCMGVYYPEAKLTFDPGFPAESGSVGLLSQSGSHCFRVIGRGESRGLRFSKVISYGNALDLNEADFLEHFADDPDTDVVGAYIEGVRDGKRFFNALRYAAARKPVVILKGGRTSAGHAAASSHTAALANEMELWRSAVRQAGGLEVSTINELVDMLVAFKHAGPARGTRVAVLGGAGGETVEAADLCADAGLELPLPPDEIREQLREELPHAWDWIGNPLDGSILPWGSRNEGLRIMEMLAAHPSYDGIIANVRGIERAYKKDDGLKQLNETLDQVKRMAKQNGKAAMLVMGEPESREEWRWQASTYVCDQLAEAGVAIYPNMERASHAMGCYLRHSLRRQE